MKNVTIALDEATLRDARRIAADRSTTLNADYPLIVSAATPLVPERVELEVLIGSSWRCRLTSSR